MVRLIPSLLFISITNSLILLCTALGAEVDRSAEMTARQWTITLEEPTGIYRRDDEIVSIVKDFAAGEAKVGQMVILTPDGRELTPQVAGLSRHEDGSIKQVELLFPASIIPGERPVYRLISRSPRRLPIDVVTEPTLRGRAIGVGRYEISTSLYAVIINLGLENTEPGIISAWHKRTGEGRMLNLIDTSPDVVETLEFGVRNAGLGTFISSTGQENGVTGNSRIEKVEIIEPGPYRLRIRMTRGGERLESWEFTAVAGSPVLTWRTSLGKIAPRDRYGFFFSSISASPYEPFNRVFDGEETRFPDGWETDNPPDRTVAPQNLVNLPGGHFLYYNRQEDYGALGIFELDQSLEWRGIGGRQFYSTKEFKQLKDGMSGSEIAISFPRWKGTVTIVEARGEYRRYAQPILAVIKPVKAPLEEISESPLPHTPISETVKIERIDPRQLTTSVPESASRVRVELSGRWRATWAEKSAGEKQGYHLASFDDRSWREVNVPGSAHIQFLEPAKVHTRDAEWISTKEWWYRRLLENPVTRAGERVWLQFEATDYYADVYLNDEPIGRHEGYIDPWSIEVTGKLRSDRPNTLAVRVWTPVSYYWRHRPYTIKGSYGAVDQKPDRITPTGITRPARLTVTGPATIDELAIDTRLNRDGSADVYVDLTIESSQSTELDVEMQLRPHNFTGREALQLRSALKVDSGLTKRQYRLHLDKPELWWTWDHGKPNLYLLQVSLGLEGDLSDSRRLKVGVREIEHVDWKFYLNGRRFFIRGTNSYYNLFLSEVGRKDYERDLELMRRMNINMIRLHCHFSNPDFYDLTDELGILIFQDYLEAWYPEDRAFSMKAAELYDPLIRYVRNHPSLAIWATSDEESLENYRDLTKHLEPRLFLHDPQRRPVVRSTGRYGDAHVYEGWYGGSIWEYTKVREKFISELGATALPNYESLIRFLPNHWPIKDHAEDWVFHKLQIFEAMRAWGSPEGKRLAEYIPQTQEYVARLFQLAIERMRRLKYNPSGGILHFHAIDLWPSVTMAALDYYRQPTKSYHTVQRSFQMVLPSFAYDRAIWKAGEQINTELWLINDRWEDIPQARVSWRVVNESGQTINGESDLPPVTLPIDSSFKWRDVLFRITTPGRYSLWATIRDGSGKMIAENNYEFEVR